MIICIIEQKFNDPLSDHNPSVENHCSRSPFSKPRFLRSSFSANLFFRSKKKHFSSKSTLHDQSFLSQMWLANMIMNTMEHLKEWLQQKLLEKSKNEIFCKNICTLTCFLILRNIYKRHLRMCFPQCRWVKFLYKSHFE